MTERSLQITYREGRPFADTEARFDPVESGALPFEQPSVNVGQ